MPDGCIVASNGCGCGYPTRLMINVRDNCIGGWRGTGYDMTGVPPFRSMRHGIGFPGGACRRVDQGSIGQEGNPRGGSCLLGKGFKVLLDIVSHKKKKRGTKEAKQRSIM